MKTIGNLAGLLLLLVGGVWFLQGIGALPGSFMSGQNVWAIRGAIAVVLGMALLWANRRGTRG